MGTNADVVRAPEGAAGLLVAPTQAAREVGSRD